MPACRRAESASGRGSLGHPAADQGL